MVESIRLLLADDRKSERETIRKQLALSRINAVIVGETGIGAETITAAEELAPDVILLSLEEPLGRPLRIIESLALPRRAPVIVLSSLGERDYLRKAMRAGAKEYLVKPLNVEELAKTIEGIFVAEQQRRSLLSSGASGVRANSEVITVFGAKGGTGKTTVATNLAVALSLETQRHVALFDLNLEQGDVPIMLDVVPDKTIVDVVRNIDRLDSESIQGFLCQHSSGVQVLAAPPEQKAVEMIKTQHVTRVIELLSRSFDYVVVDTPPKRHEIVLAALELSTVIFLVTTPEVPCLKNTKIMLEMLKSLYPYNGKVKLVVNNTNVAGVSHNEAGKALDYPIFWGVPYDSFAVECIRLGKPFVQADTRSKVSRSIIELARTLSGVGKPRKKLFGIFGKLHGGSV